MTPRSLYVLVAAGGSAALLIGALGFQVLGGLAPCPLCLLQRWPHLAAVAIGVLALVLGGRLLPVLGVGAMAATAVIGAYQVGIQRDWWRAITGCAGDGDDLSGLSGEALLDASSAGAVVLCDEVAWSLFGVSMPGWNALASALLAMLWIAALRAPGRTAMRLR